MCDNNNYYFPKKIIEIETIMLPKSRDEFKDM